MKYSVGNKVKEILSFYESENPGVKANIARILLNGSLGGSGKLIILPVDQGFEHGPIESFSLNSHSYDPHYHFELAIEAGLNAYSAPLGMIEAGASTYAGLIPLILKLNGSISLSPDDAHPEQAITASVNDALRLGCSAVGLTIYPGSHKFFSMISEIRSIISKAKSCGLAVVIWSYPRGGGISCSEGETAIDIVSYAAHIAASLGANIIKVKPPSSYIEKEASKKSLLNESLDKLSDRVRYIKKSCFAGKRLVVFSGGKHKSSRQMCDEVSEINKGGGDGSIIGRNIFQRSKSEAIAMLKDLVNIYKGC